MGLHRVAMNHRSVESTTACVQSFVPVPRFTQHDVFTDNEIGVICLAVTAAATVCEELSYKSWVNVLPEGYEAFVVELKKAYDPAVVSRENARDKSERWLGVRSVE